MVYFRYVQNPGGHHVFKASSLFLQTYEPPLSFDVLQLLLFPFALRCCLLWLPPARFGWRVSNPNV